MARPREISDERMLGAAGVVIARVGPGFTLADVAGEAKVAAGTLVHRFGSKHGLLVAMTSTAIASLREVMGAAAGREPVDVVVGVFAALDDPVTAANNLAQLAFDLADEELRGLMAEFYAVMEAGLTPLLERAIVAGELPYAPPAPVAARILTALADGTAVHWSARPDGGLCDRMRVDLGAVLDGWRPRPDSRTAVPEQQGASSSAGRRP